MKRKNIALFVLLCLTWVACLSFFYIQTLKNETFILNADSDGALQQSILQYCVPDYQKYNLAFEKAEMDITLGEVPVLTLQVVLPEEHSSLFFSQYKNGAAVYSEPFMLWEASFPLCDKVIENGFIKNGETDNLQQSLLLALCLFIGLVVIARVALKGSNIYPPDDELPNP